MVRAVASLTLLVSGAVYGQLAGPRFEVASIKPSSAGPNSVSGIKTGHGRLDANNVTVQRCIMGAFGVGPHQIFGGPDWIESDRFEIAAKADQPVNEDAALMVMLQSLLAERFKLTFHRETRTVPAYVLEVAKNGPKLEKAEDGEGGTNTSNSNSRTVVDAHNTSMDSFAKVLARQMDLLVVNQTGLGGVFHLKLQWTPERLIAKAAEGAATDGASIFIALQEQLGLRLRSQKAPVEVLVIDHVEQPSEN